MGVHTEAIQKLYVAYFNRPADYTGLAFWEGVAESTNGDLTEISKAFAASAEYKAAYEGMDSMHRVAKVYENLFGRSPELEGLKFWANALDKNILTIDNVVTEIAKGAQGDDLVVFNNKVMAATAFTAALDTAPEVLNYSGDVAMNKAKVWMSTINADVEATKAAITDAAIAAVIDEVIAVPGQSFNLTQGLDTLVGTDKNDTFNAHAFNSTTGSPATTMTGPDSIDGGAGKDVLNITLGDTHNAAIAGSFKNIETINIDQTERTTSVGVNASKFVGATLVNQIGKAGAVTGLGDKTAAGFQDVVSGALEVTATGAAAAVVFKNVGEAATVAIDGDKLASVSVSGSRVDAGTDGIAALALEVTAGKDVATVALATSTNTVLTVLSHASSADAVSGVDASASTGDVTFAGGPDVLAIKTGAGDDTVTITGVTAAATSSVAAKNATVATGAGDDKIFVQTTGTGLTSVDAGAGEDMIEVVKVANAGLNILAGAGDDTVVVSGAALATTDVIDGGAGKDVVSLAGQTSRTADDFIVLNKLLKGFETIQFSSAEGTVASKLDVSALAANYTTIDLADDSFATKVGGQSIIANGDLNVTASGYKPAAGAVDATYAGTLNVTEKVTGTVTAQADVVNLIVEAGAAGDVVGTLAGDVQKAVVITKNTVDSEIEPTVDRIASFDVTASGSALSGLKSIVLGGDGSAEVTNDDGSALVMVDATALGGKYTVGANDGKAISGLTYVSTNTAAETIKLGAGIDEVTIGSSSYGKIDTVEGLKLILDDDGNLAAASDVLKVTGVSNAVKFTTAHTDLDLALKDAAASSKGNDLVFHLGQDTYVYHDDGNNTVDAADIVVKLVGTLDIDAVIESLGGV